jgi:DNA-binding NtrC family response regulator
MGRSILIAQDDPAVSAALSIFLQGRGFDCVTARDAENVLRALALSRCDVILYGADIPGAPTGDFSRILARDFPGVVAIPLDGVRREGDAPAPPIDYEEVLLRLRQAFSERPEAGPAAKGERIAGVEALTETLIGRSRSIKAVIEMIRRLSNSPATVLITGESGTGKEVVARALHDTFPGTRHQRFLPINCAAIPGTLMESELFGHVRGAFTGATVEKRGLFEVAESGSIFLDEIGELELGLQAKLLRAIDRREIVRVGGVNPIRLEARIICATNRELKEQIERKLFREDLFYRISVVEIRLPPLRERVEDIPVLATHFITRLNRELKRSYKGIEPDALDALRGHEWRGNVRELQNVIERAMILRDASTISLDDLPSHISRAKTRSARRLKEALREYEREHIRSVLGEVDRDRERAARLLGIGVSSLYRKMRQLKIEESTF